MSGIYTKQANAVIKAVGTGDPDDKSGLAKGEFKALISVFNVIDSYGDVVMPGAFNDTLADWRAKNRPIPVIWSHQWNDIWSHIGASLNAYEDQAEGGLVVHGGLDVEDNPTARQVHKLLLAERITQFSFGFDVLEGGWGIRKNSEGEERDVYELRKLALYEVGPCLVGVNQSTELLGVKGKPPARDSLGYRKAEGSGSATRIDGEQLLAWATINELGEHDEQA